MFLVRPRLVALSSLLLSLSLFLNAARILSSSSSVLQFCSHSVCSSLPRGSFYLILRSSVAAVTPGHPNQSLCPVCVGVQRREWLYLLCVHINMSELAVKPAIVKNKRKSSHWGHCWNSCGKAKFKIPETWQVVSCTKMAILRLPKEINLLFKARKVRPAIGRP